MPAKGTPDWYRRRAGSDTLAEEAKLDARRADARVRGEFDEVSERPAFEAYFRGSRGGRGAANIEMALRRHPTRPSEYEADPTQRHWHTWQMAVGGGRLLPRYDMYKAAADRLAGGAVAATAA
jgi:hypothetical protein